MILSLWIAALDMGVSWWNRNGNYLVNYRLQVQQPFQNKEYAKNPSCIFNSYIFNIVYIYMVKMS